MRRGFALVEMMLAIFLLAIGIATTAYVIPLSTRGLQQSKFISQAAFFAQMRMEEALVSPAAPAVKTDADEPLLTGEIRRLPYGPNASVFYAQVLVYRSDDPSHRPLVELESLGSGGPGK